MHELCDNGDLILGDAENRPLAKLQTSMGLGLPFLAVRGGEHPLDSYCCQLTDDDLRVLGEWVEAEQAMREAQGRGLA